MVDLLVEVLQVAALTLLGVRAYLLARRLDEANRKVEARTQLAKDLYERHRRQLNEHIRAPIHRR